MAASTPNPLARRLAKVQEIRVEGSELAPALEALATFYTENTLANRRNLRSDIERRRTAVNRDFLGAFHHVHEQVAQLEQQVQTMAQLCASMQERVDAAHRQSAQLAEPEAALAAERALVLNRRAMLLDLLTRFTLTTEEIAVLTAPEIRPQFFEVLKHARTIQRDCKALLLTDQRSLALEIMEATAQHQESAYERLYRWVLAEARSLGRSGPDVSLSHQRALAALRDRPVLFHACVDEICSVRRHTVVQLFLEALTRGGPGGTPRPIELHAHDPMRYVSDMLAWLHQAMASERELLEGLMGKAAATTRVVPESPGAAVDGVTEIDLGTALDKVAEGTGRPLRVRVEQLLAAQLGPLVAFRLSHLLQFYSLTLARLLGAENRLVITVAELRATSQKVFYDAVSALMARTLQSAALNVLGCTRGGVVVKAPLRGAVLVPAGLNEALELLRAVLNSYDASVVPNEERETDIGPVVAAFQEPLGELARLSAATLPALDAAVLHLNCLHAIQNLLILFPFTSARAQALETVIDAAVATVAREQHALVVRVCGLAPVLDAIDRNAHASTPQPLARVPGMDARTLSISLDAFHAQLFTLTYESFLPAGVLSSRLGRLAAQLAVELFVGSYQRLSEAVFDPANKYEFPSTLIIRTPSEVGTLLGAPTPTPTSAVTSSAPVSALATPVLSMPPLTASAALPNAAAATNPVSGASPGSSVSSL